MITPVDLAAIELFILSRMRSLASGSHRGVLHGSGVDRSGLHTWQPGDRLGSIDWAQSSLTGFSPLMVRDFEQESQAAIVVLADMSLSTRHGGHGGTAAAAIERIVATAGLAATLAQDLFGVVTFDADTHAQAVIAPAGGRAHARHCLDACSAARGRSAAPGRATAAVAASLRQPGLIVVASDFLMANVDRFIAELTRLAATHDVLALLVDVRDAFTLPAVGAGWVRVRDAETGEVRLVSGSTLAAMCDAVHAAQSRALAQARAGGIDAVRTSAAAASVDAALVDAIAARRLRKACA